MNQNTFFFFISLLTRLITLCSSLNPKFQSCEPKSCGNVPNITYPFYIEGIQESYCGYPGFALSCPTNNAFPILNLSDSHYTVHQIFYHNQSIRVSDTAFSSSSTCVPRTSNLTLYGTRFDVAPKQRDLFLVFGCKTESLTEGDRVGCYGGNETEVVVGVREEGEARSVAEKYCEGGMVKTKMMEDDGGGGRIDGEVLRRGFVLNWTVADCRLCEETGGKCGFDSEAYSFSCYCPDRDHARKCDPDGMSRGLKMGLGLGLGFGIGLPVIVIIGWLIGRHCKRKYYSSNDQLESREMYSDTYSNPDPENGSIYFGVPLFSYKELKEATNNFDHTRVLGDGGFGIVYYGKLRDGREVAVKQLYEHNFRRVEQFRNEVKILANLRHKNLVSLYGCTSRQSRDLLLVYEYISNGTVSSHLHHSSSSSPLHHAPLPLSWPTRLKIAIETASALAYLHASDIIHRDVKTNNILLDANFTVKVADFGLSRMFPNDASHVSTAPQGTPGYVDPEYYQCYQLTSKSDVYSFGVVLMELVSSKAAVDMSRSKEEVNLSNLAVRKIQESAFGELVDPRLGMERDGEVRRMVVSVGELAFQCLQRERDLRPSMDEVLEALKRIESGSGGKVDVEDLEAGEGNVSTVTPAATPPPPSPPPMSPDWEEVGLLKKMKARPNSPNSVTDKWKSEATTPNVSH